MSIEPKFLKRKRFKLKIVSWNVNGIRASYPKGLMQFVQSVSPDILCLQETKAHIEQVSDEIKSLGYPYYYWSSAQRKGYSGVAVFCKTQPKSFKNGWGQSQYDLEGRIIIAEYKNFDLYNIYFPNGGSGQERHQFKQAFLTDLLTHLEPKLKSNRPIIIVGDYNVAPKPIDVYDPVRLANESGFLPEERAWFEHFFNSGFVDSFRAFHPDEKHRYSWWSYRELARVNNRGWRIDFICYTPQLTSQILSADILDSVLGSDHCPVMIDLDVTL